MSYNHVTLIGHLGKNPEVFRLGNKKPFAQVSLATHKTWSKNGTQHTRTEWHTIIFNNHLADLVEKTLAKGAKVFITGELCYQKWLDKDGIKRYSTVIQAKELRFLSKKTEQETIDTMLDAETMQQEDGDDILSS